MAPDLPDLGISANTPSGLTDKALANVNRLHDICHPSRPGGVYEPERNPGGCDKAFCCAILPEVTATVEPAIRADERAQIRAAAKAAAFTLFRPGNGPAHGMSLEVVPLAELLTALGETQ